MPCPHCGAEVMAGNRFCGQCRKRVVAAPGGVESPPPVVAAPSSGSAQAGFVAPAVPVNMERPGIVTLIAVLDLMGGGVLFVAGLAVFFSGLAAGSNGVAGLVGGVFYLLVGAGAIAVAIGLLQLKEWARMTRVVLAGIGLLGVPCGTVISILILVYLLKPGIKVLFSDRSAAQLTPQEASDVAAATKGSSMVVVAIAVVVLLVGVAVTGIVAAIAIPSLLRARIAANEADAIADMRTILFAEVAYQSETGRVATLQCLTTPQACIPGYKGSPFVVDPEITKAEKRGYRRRLVLNADGTHYRFVAMPLQFGKTGTRAFCADERTLICQSSNEGEFGDGTCDTEHCTPL